MKTITLLYLLMILSLGYCINNLQLRGCIDDSTSEDHGQCYKKLRNCFEIKECGAEFTELFNDCEIQLDDKDFNLECFQRGRKKVQHPQNVELVQCFDEVCGMFGSTPTANMDEIYKNIVENLKNQKDKSTQEQERSETEEFQCVKKALTDPEKCYKQADDCDEECSTDLDKLKSCQGPNEETDCIYDIEGALPQLVNEKAIKLANCLYDLCYKNQPKKKHAQQKQQQKQKHHEEAQIVEEL